MPLRWASCLFRPARGTASCLEVNPSACPGELQEELSARGTACLRPRGAQILYERVDDAGQGAFTPPVLVYIKRLPFCNGLEVCIKRTLITHFIGRAAREARLQVQLEHPHLLPALASIRGRHHYYLVLPAAEGDLWAEIQALRRHGSGYTEDDLRSIARQILLGLEHLHASHLAHRDIKPANVLRLADGRVVVADFGCADACTAGFVAAGTTQFQPPECRRQRQNQMAVLPKGYDQRTQDLWGVGATLACLWFARMPEVLHPGLPAPGCCPPSRGRGGAVAGAAAAAPVVVGSTLGSNNPNSLGTNSSAEEDEAAAATIAAAGEPDGDHTSGSSSAPLPAGQQHLQNPQEDGGCGGPAAAVGGGGGGGGSGRGLPKFLVAAGFAGCTSTVGACGHPMSSDLLDLLAGLLRLRAAERLTSTQALQHQWLAIVPTAASGAASRPSAAALPQPPLCGVAAATLGAATPPTPQAAGAGAATAAAAAAAVATGALQLSPLKRLGAGGSPGGAGGQFVPFLSHHQLAVHRRSSAPGDKPSPAQQGEPIGPRHLHHHHDDHDHQEAFRLRHAYVQSRQPRSTLDPVADSFADSRSHSHDESSCGPEAEEDMQELVGPRLHRLRGVSVGVVGLGQEVAGDAGQLEASPCLGRRPYAGEGEESSSPWDSQPSPPEFHVAVKPGSRRAILRVFVGAGGDGSGSG